MYTVRRLFGLFILLLITGILAACGNGTTSSGSGSASASPGPTGISGSASPSPGTTASVGGSTPTAGPTATSGSSQGQVKLEMDRNTFASSDRITVLITNNSGHSIFVSPYQSQCTMVTLERLTNNAWTSRKDCLRAPASGYGLTELKAGQNLKQTLNPVSGSGMRPASAQRIWLTGTYRVTLAYSRTSDSENATYTQVHSSNFEIN